MNCVLSFQHYYSMNLFLLGFSEQRHNVACGTAALAEKEDADVLPNTMVKLCFCPTRMTQLSLI